MLERRNNFRVQGSGDRGQKKQEGTYCTMYPVPCTLGFTFVEVLIVIALSAITGVCLFSSFSAGMKIWKRSASPDISYRKAIVGLERLSTELRRAVNFSQIGFWGDKNYISFASVFNNKTYNISYFYSQEEQCVYRSAISRAQMLDNETENTARMIIPKVKDFNLNFYGFDNETGNFSFLETWNYTTQGLPSAVKAKVSLQNGEELEKVITIPIAQ